jgi:uncharacterized LabA/DUF88 family protein
MSQYLFIDGAFFERLFSAILGKMFPDENLFAAIDLVKMTNDYDRVFYYDALPASGTDLTFGALLQIEIRRKLSDPMGTICLNLTTRKASESETDWQSRRDQKDELFNKLSMSPKIHVRSGISRYRKRRGLEQKGVDILLATEALQHSTLGNIDTACFILSDLDFYPIFDALVQNRVKSTLYYDPHKTSRDLIYAADVSIALNAAVLYPWLRADLQSRVMLSHRQGIHNPDFSQEWTAKCGGRTIRIGKQRDTDYFWAYYDDISETEIWCVGRCHTYY